MLRIRRQLITRGVCLVARRQLDEGVHRQPVGLDLGGVGMDQVAVSIDLSLVDFRLALLGVDAGTVALELGSLGLDLGRVDAGTLEMVRNLSVVTRVCASAHWAALGGTGADPQKQRAATAPVAASSN